MIKRGMTQKAIIFSAILLVICLLQTGCGNNKTFEGSRISDETGFRMEYSILDKEESAELMLTEGEQIQVSISQTSGNIDVTVGQDGEEPIYKGTGQENAYFILTIPKTGKYQFSVAGHRAKGKVSFSGIPLKEEFRKERKNKMNVTYEKKDAMTFIGYHTEIRPEEGYQKCPEFWDREYASKYARLWQTMRPETAVEKAILENRIGMFAICAESPNGFAYWIAGLYRGGEVPEGLELYSFPVSDWAVFTARGPMPDSLQTLNTAVWREWFPSEGRKYNANGTATLEVYSAGNPQSPDYECGIWVPIQRA